MCAWLGKYKFMFNDAHSIVWRNWVWRSTHSWSISVQRVFVAFLLSKTIFLVSAMLCTQRSTRSDSGIVSPCPVSFTVNEFIFKCLQKIFSFPSDQLCHKIDMIGPRGVSGAIPKQPRGCLPIGQQSQCWAMWMSENKLSKRRRQTARGPVCTGWKQCQQCGLDYCSSPQLSWFAYRASVIFSYPCGGLCRRYRCKQMRPTP